MHKRLLLICLALSACSPSEHNSQILALVGSREITQLQYELALQKLGISNPSPAIRQEIIEKLVQREQAIQQAETLNLAQQPEVQQQLADAQQDVLARAYADHIAKRADKSDANTIARYYQQHPELFAERRLFYLREIALPADFPQLNEVKTRLEQGQDLVQISLWLQPYKQNIKQQLTLRSAEQLPLSTLTQLNQTQPNQTVSFVSPRGIMLYQVLSSHPAPLSPEQASPLIQSYLDKQQARTLLLSELAQQTISVRYLHTEP